MDGDAELYGYDAFRSLYRIALDAAWYDEKQAFEYLRGYIPFIEREWANEKFSTLYTVNGTRASEDTSVSTDAGLLAALTAVEPVLAKEVFEKRFEGIYDEEGFWGDRNDYYGQNWAWFGAALYKNDFPNLWQ